MKKLILRLLEAARHYTAVDFGIFKICLLSVGILLGTYWAKFFLKYRSIVWIIAILALVIVLIETIRYMKRSRR